MALTEEQRAKLKELVRAALESAGEPEPEPGSPVQVQGEQGDHVTFNW